MFKYILTKCQRRYFNIGSQQFGCARGSRVHEFHFKRDKTLALCSQRGVFVADAQASEAETIVLAVVKENNK